MSSKFFRHENFVDSLNAVMYFVDFVHGMQRIGVPS